MSALVRFSLRMLLYMEVGLTAQSGTTHIVCLLTFYLAPAGSRTMPAHSAPEVRWRAMRSPWENCMSACPHCPLSDAAAQLTTDEERVLPRKLDGSVRTLRHARRCLKSVIE